MRKKVESAQMEGLERIRHRWEGEMTGMGDEKGGKGSAALLFAFFTMKEPRLQDERTEERGGDD